MIIPCTVAADISFPEDGLPSAFIRELEKATTYQNPKFYQAQRMGFYTGNIPRTIVTFDHQHTTMRLHRGTASKITEVAGKHGISIRWVDNRLTVPHAFKSKIVLRDYQTPAVEAAVLAGQGIIRGPCGAGKTCVLLKLIEVLGQRALVVVWNGSLMEQWIERVHDFYGMRAGIIGQGKHELAPITCGMQQSLARGCDEYLDKFGTVIVDETHRLAASSWQTVVNKFPAKHRIGASANETRKDGLDFLVYDTLGELVHEIRYQQLEDEGVAMPVKIRVIQTDYDDPMYRESRGAAKDYTGMLNDLVQDTDRNRLILDTIMSEYDPHVRRPMLLLTERRTAVDYWHKLLNDRGIKTGLMLGGAGSRRATEETRRGLISGEVDCAVATVQIAGEGLDITELSRMYITTPMAKHWRRMEQVVGRLKRVAHGKTDAVAYYFLDRTFPRDLKAIQRKFENVEVM